MDVPDTQPAGLTPEHLAVVGEPEPPVTPRSTSDLLKSIGNETATLFRKEAELARQEIVEAVTARMIAAGGFAAAGVLGLFVLAFLGAGAAAALDYVVPAWASRLIVAGVFLVMAAVGGLIAMRKVKKPSSMAPEETVRTVKEDVEWAKAQLKR